MPKKRIRYRIEKTRNKHSRAVYRDDVIVIRLARGLSDAEAEDHVQSLLKRMTKQIVQDLRRTNLDPFRSLLSGEQTHTITLVSGDAYTITLMPAKRQRVLVKGDTWLIGVPPRMRRQELHRLLWTTLAKHHEHDLTARVHRLNAGTLKVKVNRVRIAFASSQWGSCSPRGVIMINAALLFVPEHLLDYVIIHELAHRKRADHSPRYWNIVADVFPEYQAARKELRSYRLPSL